jgi:hypothetical protein
MISILVFDIETPDRTEMVVLAKTALSSVDICSVLVVTISDVVCDEITDGVDISLDVKCLRGVDVSDTVWDDLDDVDTSRDDSDETEDNAVLAKTTISVRSGVSISKTRIEIILTVYILTLIYVYSF